VKETQNIEWKESWRDEYLKWIAGFANADGGKLLIGVNDKGVVVGLGNAKTLLEELPNKIRDVLGIVTDIHLRQEKHLEYLEIVVEAHPYPVSYKGQYHYRSGSTKQELKGAALDKFLLGKQGKRWDAVPLPRFGIENCSPKARSGRGDAAVLQDTNLALLENLHLFEGEYLKRAAALLFFDDPEKFVTGAYIKIGFFVTDDDLRY
jgi:ATP-dependent DNA helicase RecG